MRLEESGDGVHLVDFVVVMGGGLVIIDSILLFKSLRNPSGFESSDCPFFIPFECVDPFAPNDSSVFRGIEFSLGVIYD